MVQEAQKKTGDTDDFRGNSLGSEGEDSREFLEEGPGEKDALAMNFQRWWIHPQSRPRNLQKHTAGPTSSPGLKCHRRDLSWQVWRISRSLPKSSSLQQRDDTPWVTLIRKLLIDQDLADCEKGAEIQIRTQLCLCVCQILCGNCHVTEPLWASVTLLCRPAGWVGSD